jgi:hypothetical protein
MDNFFSKNEEEVAVVPSEEILDAITSSEVVEVFSEEDLTKEDESDIDWETL